MCQMEKNKAAGTERDRRELLLFHVGGQEVQQ